MKDKQIEIPIPKQSSRVYMRAHTCEPDLNRYEDGKRIGARVKKPKERQVLMEPSIDPNYFVGLCRNCNERIIDKKGSDGEKGG